jgi:hypothetical protein
MQDLPEFKVLEDEGRRAAFVKYIKRQKVLVQLILLPPTCAHLVHFVAVGAHARSV